MGHGFQSHCLAQSSYCSIRGILWRSLVTEVDTFTVASPPLMMIKHHYSNVSTQFITQFITQIPLLKSLLIITQMPFSLLMITPQLLKGLFADVDPMQNGSCWEEVKHRETESALGRSSGPPSEVAKVWYEVMCFWNDYQAPAGSQQVHHSTWPSHWQGQGSIVVWW